MNIFLEKYSENSSQTISHDFVGITWHKSTNVYNDIRKKKFKLRPLYVTKISRHNGLINCSLNTLMSWDITITKNEIMYFGIEVPYPFSVYSMFLLVYMQYSLEFAFSNQPW